MIRKSFSYFLIPILFLSGCAFYPKNNITEVSKIAQLSDDSENKPIVFIDYKRSLINAFGGEHPIVISQNEYEELVNFMTSLNYFKDVIYDEYEKDKADISISLKLYDHLDKAGGLKLLINAFSFTLIPVSLNFDFSSTMEVIDKNGEQIFNYSNKDGFKMWFGLFMIPFGKKTEPNHQYYRNNLVKDCFANYLNNYNDLEYSLKSNYK